MYLSKTPAFLKPLASDFLWHADRSGNEVYFTFDDGPIPEVTPWVMDTLATFESYGTFFCVGDNVSRNHAIYEELLDRGHTVGNHTFNHVNGWQTSNLSYYRNTLQASSWIESDLFRPPYGKITRSQAQGLKSRYQLVMWDVLSGDFDQSLSAESVLQRVISHVQPGSVIVFHDSLKAADKLYYALPRALEYCREKGLACASLPNSLIKPTVASD